MHFIEVALLVPLFCTDLRPSVLAPSDFIESRDFYKIMHVFIVFDLMWLYVVVLLDMYCSYLVSASVNVYFALEILSC